MEKIMEIKALTFPNYGTVETHLADEYVSNFYKLIEEAKEKPHSMNNILAGNISSSIELNMKSKFATNFVKNVIPSMVTSYVKQYGFPIKHITKHIQDNSITLEELWVNFQRKHEFNPIHDHNGMLSFVIWLSIPTSSKKQNELPFSKNSGSKGLISNFSFVYTDILGNIKNYVYQMEKDIEGYMVMFPSRLMHQVFPFYESEKERITISGNVGISTKQVVTKKLATGDNKVSDYAS